MEQLLQLARLDAEATPDRSSTPLADVARQVAADLQATAERRQQRIVLREPMAPGITRTWELTDVLCDVHTEFQHLVIGRTEQGISLFSDSDRQSTEFSQLVYHEALMVPAMLLAERIDRVLIIGSGEGVASQMVRRARNRLRTSDCRMSRCCSASA